MENLNAVLLMRQGFSGHSRIEMLAFLLTLFVAISNDMLATRRNLLHDFEAQNRLVNHQEPELPAAESQTEDPNSSNGRPGETGRIPAGPFPMDLGRNSVPIKLALQPLAEKWKNSIVRFDRAPRPGILGTIVTQDGLVIAKLSELAEPLNCVLNDGRRVPGSLVASDRQLDLALIKIEANALTPIKFHAGPPTPTLGDFLVSIDQGGQVIGVGVVSTNLDRLPLEHDPRLNRIRMGIDVNPLVESKTVMVKGKYVQKLGLRIQKVEPRSVGEAANLIVNDLVCSVDGKAVSSLEGWNAAMQDVSIGQLKRFEVIRNDKLLITSAETKSDSQRTRHDFWGGGPFNERRFDFGRVIIHDGKIRPENCGGPVFDLDGNCVGINIARSLRVASFAIPSQQILQWILAVQPNANLSQTDNK
jgi:serine protease Do